MSTTSELVKTLKDNITVKLNRGDTGVAKDLRELHDLEKLLEKEGPVEIREGTPIRVKRTYTMTEAARAQRLAASARSTGPTSVGFFDFEEHGGVFHKNKWTANEYRQSERWRNFGTPAFKQLPYQGNQVRKAAYRSCCKVRHG
jgi:hypothetical protein